MNNYYNISTFKAIYDIAQTLNLSLSAKRLNKQQGNLSRIIIKFEKDTGIKIFDRTTRPVSITPAGQHLIALIEQHLTSYQALHDFVVGYKKVATGKVRIDAPAGELLLIARYVLPELARRYPDIQIELHTSNLTKNDLTYGVNLKSECDILFTHTLPSDESLLAYRIISIPISLYGTAELVKKHPIKEINDLCKVPCILYDAFMSMGTNIWQFKYNEQQCDVSVNGHYSCDNAFTALEMALAGLGYLYAPDLLISETRFEGKLLPAMPDGLTAGMTSYMIYKPRFYQPYRVELVLSVVSEILMKLTE